MKKLCFFTCARSEYGLLRWLMKDINDSDEFELQLVVTGAHLLNEQGYTIDNIKQDGFVINAVVDPRLDISSSESIASSMGRMAEKIAPVLSSLRPDYVIVLGDRYELLPICSTAYVMNIPLVHISGGDITQGAIDDGIRNAVTMLATYHFPATSDSADNIIRMRNSRENIWTVGELGLDSFYRYKLMDREETAASIGLDLGKKWILMTCHPETTKSLDYNISMVSACCNAISTLTGYQAVMTYANADFGGKDMNRYIRSYAASDPESFICIPSLGNLRYLSLMQYVDFVIGNSSSGIIEAPLLKKHVVNIGNRQQGRHICSNITCCGSDESSIKEAIEYVINHDVVTTDIDYWGDGHTSSRITEILINSLSCF